MPAPKKTSKASAKSAKAKEVSTNASAPQIDVSQSAQSVAAALAARAKQGGSTLNTASTSTADSAAFKQLKANLGKPQFSANSPLAGGGVAPKHHSSNPFGKSASTGHAGGPNVARTGVPRRTNGG